MSDTELLHKSKLEPARRLEVFTGAGRRRTWTAEQKAQILAESYESGEKVSAVALLAFLLACWKTLSRVRKDSPA